MTSGAYKKHLKYLENKFESNMNKTVELTKKVFKKDLDYKSAIT